MSEKRDELWRFVEYICGKRRGGLCGPLCDHEKRDPNTGNTCNMEDCPALEQAEKVFEMYAGEKR